MAPYESRLLAATAPGPSPMRRRRLRCDLAPHLSAICTPVQGQHARAALRIPPAAPAPCLARRPPPGARATLWLQAALPWLVEPRAGSTSCLQQGVTRLHRFCIRVYNGFAASEEVNKRGSAGAWACSRARAARMHRTCTQDTSPQRMQRPRKNPCAVRAHKSECARARPAGGRASAASCSLLWRGRRR